MSRRKNPIEKYRKRKERTHSTQDILQEFDNSMQSPEIPAATQPQDVSGRTYLPPAPKRSKIPPCPDIDLTTEPDTAVEQPLPMVLSSLVPLTTTNSAPNPPGQVSDAQNVINFLHCVKDAFQSPISSPSITTQEYPRPLANENLVRAPIKSQRQQQQSSGRDHVTGAPPKSNPHQSSSLMGRTEMSFAPSMDCTLPLVQNKAPSVRTSPPNKRNSIGSYHSDIKRLPQGLSRTPGSLLADAYSPSGFCNSSPTKPNTSPSQQSSCDVAGGNHDVAGGRRRGNGCQRNLLDKKQVESVVVIDEEEGERLKDNSRHQTKPSKGSRDSQKAPSDVSELHVVSCGNGTLFESQAGSGEHRGNTSLSIPPYHDLKEQSPRAKMKLKKTQEAKRPGYKEKVDSNAVFISSAPAAPPVYVDAGEPTDSTGNQTSRHTCTVASSSAESDSDVFVTETTSRYFESDERNKRRKRETPPVTKEVWPSSTRTPPTDILATIEPTQQRVSGAMPRDKSSSQINFVPRFKDGSPENDHSNLKDGQIASKHHNCFAKNPSSSGGARVESISSESSGKAKPRLPKEALNTTPTLSKSGFSFTADEKPATGKDSKSAKKTSQTKKNDEVIFQAEEAPGGRKQYNMRGRDRHIRVIDSSDDAHSCEEDDDFQSQPSWKKTTTTTKRNTDSFYGGDTYFSQVMIAANKNLNSKEGMMKLNRGRPMAATSKTKGSKQTTKGTGKYKNPGDVLKGLNVKSLGKIQKRQQRTLTTADDDESTLDLNMVQIGRLISNHAFNLEVKNKEVYFQFECDGIVHRQFIELKHLTSWKMNLGEGPKFIAIETDLFVTNKLRSSLVSKFHLREDFFKLGGQDPSQHYIIFCLSGDVSPQHIANINEVLDGLSNVALNYCDVCRDMSPKAATEFLESVRPTEPAKSDVPVMSNKEISTLLLPDKDTSDDSATITSQSSQAPRKEQEGWVRRSTRKKRPPTRMYRTSSFTAIDDSDSQEEEPCVQKRSKTPNVKLMTYKPQGSKMTLDIMSADVECLDPGEYLNDKIIDFYLNYLLYERLSEEFRSRVHIFSTFFYTRLSNASMDDKASKCSTPEKIHSRVKTWTRRVDLFLKDYIILPVCDRAHWYVVIVCHPGLFDPSKVKPPQPRKPKSRARTRKSMRLNKKKQSQKGEDIDQGDGDKEEKSSPSQQQQQEEDDRLEIKEGITEETEVMNMEADIFCLPQVAEVRGGVCMSSEALQQASLMLNLDSIGDSELLEGGENMELGEGEGESPFQHLVLTDIIPETPPSSQECVINDEREDREKDRNRDDSVSSSTIVLSSQDTLNNSVAACNDRDSMNIVESARTEDTVICTPMNTEKPQKQAATDLNSELAGSATADYLSLETGSITIHDGGEGEPLNDDVIDENEEGDVEEEGSAAGVESVEVKQEPLEEEETEPQKWPCIQILDSLGIKRPSTAKRIRNYLTMEWKSKKADKEDEMSFEHLPLQYPAIPLQDNSSDCGIFVLQFIESLLGTIQEGLPPPSVAEEWASYEKTRAKRKEIEQLITKLQNRDKAS